MGKPPTPNGVGGFLLFTSTMNLKGKQYDIQSIVLIHGHPHAGGENVRPHVAVYGFWRNTMLGAWCFQARRPATVCGRTLIPNQTSTAVGERRFLTKINDDPRRVVVV